MLTFTIADIVARYGDFRTGVVVAEGLTIRSERPAALEQVILAAEQETAAALAGVALADVPELRCWREAYKAFGVKKTSYRSSIERLLKRVQQGSGLPRVNALVDTYNLISLRYRMPVGADDLENVVSPLRFRYARPGDTFIAPGDETREPDPPAPGEVVYADAEKLLCRRWNWYQDARSPISAATTSAVLTVQALQPTAALVEEAVTGLCALLATHCGARTSWAIAGQAQPEVMLALSAGSERVF
jgi:DNA/RNA-binding domain of Phe-tRNA-synthetase-like protein